MNPKILNSIGFILLILWVLELLIRLILFPFYFKSLDNFFTVNLYHKLEHKYRKPKAKDNWSQYYNYLLVIILVGLIGCNATTTHNRSSNVINIITSDITRHGRIEVIKYNECTYLLGYDYIIHDHNCLNPIHYPVKTDYQITINNDSIISFNIYDNNRLVGKIQSKELTKLIIKDNE